MENLHQSAEAAAQAKLAVPYLIAGILFIMSLGGLSSQETARRGNFYGILGMIIATVATFMQPDMVVNELLIGAMVLGCVIGGVLAARVVMTGMPQLVAILHSFVGLAAVLVGISTYMSHPDGGTVHGIEVWLGVAIGSITFTGSVIAWAKLRGSMSGTPLLLPGRHLLNLIALVAVIAMAVPFIQEGHTAQMWGILQGEALLYIMTGITALLGIHLVMAIGGADMPVVVSLLNSYSGWAAAAAGFMLNNNALIITGALVGSSGAILSFIMCKAMNRSIWNVVFGGFGTGDSAPAPSSQGSQGEIIEADHDQVSDALANAKSVVIVPGYGMAVARAQHLVNDLSGMLAERGVLVRYAIHPVAGRLPGHMNVLLAEAGVSYDMVLEMEEINDDFPKTDVVLVIGANDIVNPGAQTDASSPIYGMPVLEAWKSETVVVLKRGMGAGYAGVANPLFFHENTWMLFGDARESIQSLVGKLRES
ncbi:MAG: NAD(P) transhydrogenase subunit beta [Deltaproteobacteria bacterium]|nr:NAD(P) transhydrogenase subunit beta [Deltaproteobacteria bacterium]